MDTFDSIYQRRSIRKFKEQEISRENLQKILEATLQAPSGKNRQPWSFIVLDGEKKNKLIDIMLESIAKLKRLKVNTGSSEYSAKCMKQAPILVLVFNEGIQKNSLFNPSQRYMRLVDIQSIGGAIQTMLLAAQQLGLGTLWICDIFYADKEICTYVNKKEELIAAVSIGYPDENPNPRPRKKLDEVVVWMD